MATFNLFYDVNVYIDAVESAGHKPASVSNIPTNTDVGLLMHLAAMNKTVRLSYSSHIAENVTRVLTRKGYSVAAATEWADMFAQLSADTGGANVTPRDGADLNPFYGVGAPDWEDARILAAAVDAGASTLVTGDWALVETHLDGMTCVTPSDYIGFLKSL